MIAMKALTYFFTTFIILYNAVVAQEGLYDPTPPANSAFVRIIQADSALSTTTSSIGDVVYGDLEYLAISPYHVVQQGSYEGRFGDITTPLEVAAGNFYTVAIVGGKALLLQDPVNGNLTKTLLILYNLSDLATVDMKTADGSTAVISGVTSQTLNSILVNPIEISLAAFGDHQSVQAFNDLSLKPGATYSMIVTGPAEHLMAAWSASLVKR
jgi:alginate O-acetyltransferase complex protein AlgF